MKDFFKKKIGKVVVAAVALIATVAAVFSANALRATAGDTDPVSSSSKVTVKRLGPTLDEELSVDGQHIYTVSLDALGGEPNKTVTKSAVSIVIDCSASMNGVAETIGVTRCTNKYHSHYGETKINGVYYTSVRKITYLDLAKQAAIAAVEELLANEDTEVSIVSYHTGATTSGRFFKKADLAAAKSHINGLSTPNTNNYYPGTQKLQGGTNIQAGIDSAANMLAANTADKKSMILLSDGAPTFGYKITELASTESKYFDKDWYGDYELKEDAYQAIKNVNTTIVGNGTSSEVEYVVKTVSSGWYSTEYYVSSVKPATLWEAKEAQKIADVYTIYFKTTANATTASEESAFLASLATDENHVYNANSENIGEIYSTVAGSTQIAATNATVTDFVGYATIGDVDYEWAGFVEDDAAWSYDPVNGKITWNISDIKNNETKTLTYMLREKKYDVTKVVNGVSSTTSYFFKDTVDLGTPAYDTDRLVFKGWKQTAGTRVSANSFTMPKDNLTFVAQFEDRTYDLTINYVDEAGNTLAKSHAKTVKFDDVYNVTSPDVKGYSLVDAKQATVAGTIAGDVKVDVVYKKVPYSISYTLNGGVVNGTNPVIYYVDSEAITVINPVKTGYTFDGWTGTDLNGATKTVVIATGSTGDKSFTANWVANTDTAYTVEHYLMNVDGERYTLEETESLKGTTDTEVTPAVKNYEGFIAPATQTATIAADGSTVVKYYYTRNQYTVTANAGYGIDTTEGSGTYYYGALVEVDATAKTGYTFDKWTGDFATDTFTMPAKDVKMTATATLDEYKIEYVLNNGVVDGINPTTYTVETETFSLIPPTKYGYNFTGWTGTNLNNPVQDVSIKKGSTGDRKYIANFVEKRCSVVIKYLDENGNSIAPTIQEAGIVFGSTHVETAKDIKGYTLTSDKIITYTMDVEKGKTIIFTYKANLYDVTVKYVDENNKTLHADGKVEGVPYKTKYTVKAEDIAGYTVKGEASVTELMDSIEGKTVTFIYTANTNTAYTVNHYLMNLDGKTYELKDTDNLTDTTDTQVTPEVNSYEGFTAPETQTVTVKGDGTTVVDYYYTRNPYKVTVTAGTGVESTSGSNTYLFGAEVTIGAELKTGYTGLVFTGDETVTTFTMPAKHVNVLASANAIVYTIEYNLDGGSVNGTNPATYTVESADITLINPVKTGYTFLGWTGTGLDEATEEVTITTGSTGDRKYVANWSADLFDVTVQFVDKDGNKLADDQKIENVAFDDSYTAKALEITGYTLDGDAVVEDVMDTVGGETVVFTYDINQYELVIKYVYEDGTEAADEVRETLDYKAEYNVETPVIEDYTANLLVVEGTMPAGNVEVTVTFVEHDKNTVTVNYFFNDVNGATAAPSVTITNYVGKVAADEVVKTPEITGYTADIASVDMNDYIITEEAQVINVVYTINTYKVTYIVDGTVVNTVDATYGDSVADLLDAAYTAKEGFIFSGWSTDYADETVSADVTIVGSTKVQEVEADEEEIPTEEETDVETEEETEKNPEVEADDDVVTADPANVGLLIALLGVSAVALATVIIKRRNDKKNA